MTFFDKIQSVLPFFKKATEEEYFFALNIGQGKLTAALWGIIGNKLEIINIADEKFLTEDEIISTTDKLLDSTLGDFPKEPEKILFGVPDSWLVDENLKDQYSKILQNLTRELGLKPLAYVSTTHAISFFQEKKDNAPLTSILIGIDQTEIVVTIVRASKVDSSKVIKRGESLGEDIEKGLLLFSGIEVLPSKILIYGSGELAKIRNELMSFSWMSKLSFLHLPRIDVLEDNVEIKAVALAGGSEDNENLRYNFGLPIQDEPEIKNDGANFGFTVGDVIERELLEPELPPAFPEQEVLEEEPDVQIESGVKITDRIMLLFHSLSNHKFPKAKFMLLLIILLTLLAAFLLLPSAQVTIFIEPKILEKDAQVTADPKVTVVDGENKIIPGQIVETQVDGSDKGPATGKKSIGNPAKGVVIIYNQTTSAKTFSKGTSLTAAGVKFTLDSSATVASQSAVTDTDKRTIITPGTTKTEVSAAGIGPEGNIPSGTELSLTGLSANQFSAKSEGNFSGGTSKEVTVVTDDDQKRVLASLLTTLRQKAQSQLQAKLTDKQSLGSDGPKKVIEEALSEEVVKKTYNKNINDQTNEFSLNMTVKFKGTAYVENDLRKIVSKLIETNVPEGFELNLNETETRADVSKLEKDGKVIFLARFRAKLIQKFDSEKIKSQIRGHSVEEAVKILKNYENILGSEIKISPSLPKFMQRLPLLTQRINIEVSLK